MASPDITPYVDLTLFDKQPVDIYNDAVQYARTALPEWTPVPGSVEDAILQAAAQMTGEVAASINRLPSGIVEALLRLFGVERSAGAAATGTIQITAIDTAGYTIPAGTRFGYLWSDPSTPSDTVLYTFDTSEDLEIPAGSSVGTVDIAAPNFGLYPALQAGATLRLLSGVSFINSAALTADLNIGAGQETDAEYFTRGIALLRSYSSALVTAEQYRMHVLGNYAAAYRCVAYSRLTAGDLAYDPMGGNLADGHLTLFVAGAGGNLVATSTKNTIKAELEDRGVAGLTISVLDPTFVPVSVTCTVTMRPGYTQGDVSDKVAAAIGEYFHPNTWEWSHHVYYNEIVALIDRVTGVDRVVSLGISSSGAANMVGDDLRFTNYGAMPVVTASVTVSV